MTQVRPASSSFGFGTSTREKVYKSERVTPGPGQYTSKSQLGQAPARTMPGRRKDLRPKAGTDAPGAGAYNPIFESTRKSLPTFSIA